jgi:hypothetical protein
MRPQGAIAGPPGLEFGRRLAGAVTEGGVFLGSGGGQRIEAFEVLQRHRSFAREGAFAFGQKGVGLAFVAGGDDQQAHLEAPVAEMGVAPRRCRPGNGTAVSGSRR